MEFKSMAEARRFVMQASRLRLEREFLEAQEEIRLLIIAFNAAKAMLATPDHTPEDGSLGETLEACDKAQGEL